MGTDDEPLSRHAWVGHAVPTVRESLHLEATATARAISGMRRDLAAWLALDVAPGDVLDDVVLAAYEALANVVDHAYPPGTVGGVRLTADRARDFVRLTVADDGRWAVPSASPFRGRGLAVMRLLFADVEVETSGSGTNLHLWCALPEPGR